MKTAPRAYTVLCALVKLDTDKKRLTKKTVSKWVWLVIKGIADLEAHVIKWNHRYTNNVGNDCFRGIDDLLRVVHVISSYLKPGNFFGGLSIAGIACSGFASGGGLQCCDRGEDPLHLRSTRVAMWITSVQRFERFERFL